MPSVTINGTAFSGTPAQAVTPWAPSNVETAPRKVGTLLESANGTRTFQHRAHKYDFTLSWNKCDTQTRAAIRTIFLLTTTFAFVDHLGGSYTVLCDTDGLTEEIAVVSRAGAMYYNVKLTVKQT